MRLTINASRKYDVVIEENFASLKKEMVSVVKSEKLLIVADDNTERYFLDIVLKELNDEYTCFTYIIKSGENSKNTDNYISILRYLTENHFTRKDCVVALGGGVVGDLAGFVASTYMRGILYVQLPTTLLSMIDSSVGGKTAINLEHTKNVVGTFYQPCLVYASVLTLKTLDKREVISGFGEAIKYAFLSRDITKEDLNKDKLLGNSSREQKLIYKCVDIKRRIVEEDEKESGKRALLNLGHTIGHAVEALSVFTISHGQCVLMGIKKIIEMSSRYYALSDEKKNEMLSLVNSSSADLDYSFGTDEIIDMIMSDKKSTGKGTNLVLIKDIGSPEIVYFDTNSLRRLYDAS